MLISTALCSSNQRTNIFPWILYLATSYSAITNCSQQIPAINMKHVLHYGLQRSGTNYLETLLTANYNVLLLNNNDDRKHPLQKHFRLYADQTYIPEPQYLNDLTFSSFADYEQALGINQRPDLILVISKDPYSWWVSYVNWAKKCKWPEVAYHYIQEYNQFYGTWNRFRKEDSRIHFVRYIDMLTHPEKELTAIAKKYDLSEKSIRKLLGVKTQFKSVSHSNNFTTDKRIFYAEKEYLSRIDPSEMERINSKLDWELMDDLGYEIERGSIG